MFVILRLVSLLLIVAALMLLGADIITSLENGGKIMVRSLDTVWASFDHSGNGQFHIWCEAHLPGMLDRGIWTVTGLPGWAVSGVPGIILAFLFGRRIPGAA